MSPSHLFFRPVESSNGCYSSTLRGRGLTALKEEGKKKSNITLLSYQNESLSVKASIENMLEWHHEHDPETIQSDDECKSRVAVARGWLEVSHALHDPIPIED
ncbi:unnamed protein product [Cylindrotheca closterium]|uniref:Uncharacterized protein n=1 Tax=Cylindrotheca closterium TaxID=2856 RepID=A0AAD2JIC2_9STRA|nr:unnamed protein product [Cylindrotheca closterium]